MVKIPQNIQELKSYNPGKSIGQIIADYGLKETAILWNNENNFGASPMAQEEIAKAAVGTCVYPDPLSLELRSLIAKENNCTVDEVVVGNGSEAIMSNMFKAFCASGDEVLTSEGTFVAIYIWAKSSNIPCMKVPLNASYGFDADAIVDAITPATKIVYIANPNNPTGTILSKEEIHSLMRRVPAHVVVVIDEAYIEYAVALDADFPDTSTMDYPNLLTFRTFSKAYGIAGARIGYAIGAPELIEALNKVRLTFAPSNIAQAAGIGAIKDKAFLEKTIQNNTDEIKAYYEFFEAHKVRYIPSYGNFVMIPMESPEDAAKLFQDLLERGVFVRVLAAFGLPHCVRITIGTPEDNQLFFKAFREVYPS